MLDPTEPDEEEEYLLRTYRAVQGLNGVSEGPQEAALAPRKPDLPSPLPSAPPAGDRASESPVGPLGAPEMTIAVRRALLLANLERTLALLWALEDE